MKKYLLLTGFLAVLTLNSAHANDYNNQNNSYYREQPRYRRLTNEEARRYKERQIYKAEGTQTNKIRPYIGLDMNFSKMKFGNNKYMKDAEGRDQFKDEMTSFGGNIGVKINSNFGVEAYYQQSTEKKNEREENIIIDSSGYSKFDKSSISYKSYGVDFIGYLPISQNFELLAALGIGQYDFKSKVPGITWSTRPGDNEDSYILEITDVKRKKDLDSLGIRLGIGAKYNITNHVALRGMFRYIKMTDDDYIKDLMEASLGIQYMF